MYRDVYGILKIVSKPIQSQNILLEKFDFSTLYHSLLGEDDPLVNFYNAIFQLNED